MEPSRRGGFGLHFLNHAMLDDARRGKRFPPVKPWARGAHRLTSVEPDGPSPDGDSHVFPFYGLKVLPRND